MTKAPAGHFLQGIREKLQIMPILRQLLLFAEHNMAEMEILREYNCVKAIVNQCVVDIGSKRLILLPVLHSMMAEIKIKNRIENIKKSGSEFLVPEDVEEVDRRGGSSFFNIGGLDSCSSDKRANTHLKEFFKLNLRKAYKAIFDNIVEIQLNEGQDGGKGRPQQPTIGCPHCVETEFLDARVTEQFLKISKEQS